MNRKLLFLVLVSLTLLSCQSQGEEDGQGVEGLRSNASLSSPYVDVRGDTRFPLLVRVWVNVDTSHIVQVQNNDPDFPLSYERPVSEEGFIPIVGLKFGDNNFDVEVRDNNSKVVAEHSLTAEIEDQENIQSWLTVEQAASSNDFSSVHLYASGSPFGMPINSKYRLVVDDLGEIRWAYRWSGETNRGQPFYPLFTDIVENKIYIADDEGIRIFSVDVFGNRELVFDGDKLARKYAYKVHHGFAFTDQGTLLILADVIEKTFLPPANAPMALITGDYLIEVDLETGLLLRRLDLKNTFPVASENNPTIEDVPPETNWLHTNAIDYSPGSGTESGSIIISGRNQSAVFALDYATSTLKWLFSDPANWQNETGLSPAPLTTVPADYRFHKGQHDIQLDGNRLRFFDNSVSIKDTMGEPIPTSQIKTRIVEGTLDLSGNQVTGIKVYEPQQLFSQITGGFDFYDDTNNSNYLICYCGIARDSDGNYAPPAPGMATSIEGQTFEVDPDNSDQTLLHFRVRGVGYRARYFDWEEMVK